MAEKHISLVTRLREFTARLTRQQLLSRTTQLNWWGWLLSLFGLTLAYSFSWSGYWSFFLLIHLVFLIGFVIHIDRNFRPPIEALLLVLYLFTLFSRLLINATVSVDPSLQEKNVWLALLILLTSLMALNFSLIIVHNRHGKKAILLTLTALGLLGYVALSSDNDYAKFFFYALTLITLLQNTRWLEELSKLECWIYLLLLFFFYRTIAGLNPFSDIDSKTLAGTNGWYLISAVLFQFNKFYLLAMLIKIPVVLIYNHASLSRKLKISGLFQSTFPQLIQFVLLTIIFYSFLSGWQAENLRRTIQDQLEKFEHGAPAPGVEWYKIDLEQLSEFSKVVDYEPTVAFEQLRGIGVIEMRHRPGIIPFIKPRNDFFIFLRQSSRELYLIKIDEQWLRSITKNLRYLAGTSMNAYPLTPSKWSSYIYRADFLWQRERHIRIFPLGALPIKSDSGVSIQLDYPYSTPEKILNKFEFLFKDKYQLVFGRVYLPFWQEDKPSNRFLAFDIIMKLEPVILFSGLPQILMVLLVIYLLFNSFVVRQVVKFGEQINETIIEKFAQLRAGIQQIATGNLDHKITLEGEDEFVELADHFNEMGQQLKKKIAEARERDLFEYELQLARQVQLSLLPQHLPQIPNFELAASMQTANTVGGDFYDIFAVDNQRYLFTIGDVSGKGSSAALYMAQCMSLVRFSRQFTSDPKQIASRLNNYFATTILDRQIFVTSIIGILNPEENKLQFTRAGHCAPIIVPADPKRSVQLLESRGLGIGLTQDARMFERANMIKIVTLAPGDVLVCYTDGIIEAARLSAPSSEAEFELYGEPRLLRLLESQRGKGAQEILKAIEADIAAFYNGHPRVDDHTILILKCCK
ncbi:MAG: SpoIIE family protein phosphatase [candidate division KSB1 bacterium]|nr:SpoIIE family protein phosphatase [candidate division KSB1 bacterium]MDZ7335583.1 SpoIIE family protein phosphatase [candidate division KSB1 bacterium]MDZ7356455.1 SpoIIE family protein phosphatase [candidate division KSB1 bacterium]MDZ7401226.1 SpoIIE family protein phosphatase [candidate division KSB1 bacterium]